jgi:uncharacterized iron-regulated protein
MRGVSLMRWAPIASLLCLYATAGAASELNWGTWAEEVRKQHPLAGSVYVVSPPPPSAERQWQTSIASLLGKYDLDNRVEGDLIRPLPPDGRGLVAVHLPSRIVLLGELHDNPLHHQVRAWVIGNTAKMLRDWRPAVVFEQIRIDQQSALDRLKSLNEVGSGTADDLFRLLEWDKSGWPPSATYKPLIEAVVAAKLPILAGNLPNDRVRAVARGGRVPSEDRARLKLENPMPASLTEALERELAGSHCGVLPPTAVAGMAEAQRYRDAQLADAVLSAYQRHGAAILIAGNGHVRKDRGVPWHILRRAPKSEVVSVFILEVEGGKTDPEAYVPRDPEGKPAADLLIFTPRAKRADPCAAMRKTKQ